MKYLIIIIALLLAGCADQPEAQQAAQPSESKEECTVLDGTWRGLISDSGVLEVTRDNQVTSNPFTAQYQFEMTIKCRKEWEFNITRVKSDHPLFKCEQGCTPKYGDAANNLVTWFLFDANNVGHLQVVFPNDAVISFPITGDADDKGVYISGDKLAIHIPGKYDWETIGSLTTPDNIYWVETHNCEQYGGEGFCIPTSIDPNTVYLSKVD